MKLVLSELEKAAFEKQLGEIMVRMQSVDALEAQAKSNIPLNRNQVETIRLLQSNVNNLVGTLTSHIVDERLFK